MTPRGLDPALIEEVRNHTPAAPDKQDRIRELAAVREAVRLPLMSPKLLFAPRGTGQRVMVIPGYSTGDAFMTPLRTYLRTRNHDAVGWGEGVNGGDVKALVDVVRTKLIDQGAPDKPVNLIGWSLGGVIAREVARDRPDMVTSVITFGTPLFGPRYTTAADSYSDDQIEEIEQQINEREPDRLTVPITAIFSRNDAIVDWRTCVDLVSPDVDHVEVTSTHVGMTIDPEVWCVIAQRLAATRAGSEHD